MVTLEIDTPADDGGQPVLSYRYSYFPTENDSDIQESSVGQCMTSWSFCAGLKLIIKYFEYLLLTDNAL